MADTRTWEQLTPAERRERLKNYNKSVKKENAQRRASTPAEKPAPKKKGKGDHMTNIYTVVKSRNKVIDKRVDDASK